MPSLANQAPHVHGHGERQNAVASLAGLEQESKLEDSISVMSVIVHLVLALYTKLQF